MCMLPGWNSLETVTRLTKFFTVSGFLSLFLLGAFEILAYIYGNRKDALIAGNQAAIDAVRTKQEEQQRKDNEASMEQVKRELREAQQQGVQTSEQLAQSNRKVSNLEKRTADRNISPEQRTILNTVLSANHKYGITVTCNMGDQEGMRFAQQFISIFRENGWTVDGPNQAIYDLAPEGLQLTVKDGKNPPPGASVILNALKQAHIDYGAFQNPSTAEGIIDFRVGSRP